MLNEFVAAYADALLAQATSLASRQEGGAAGTARNAAPPEAVGTSGSSSRLMDLPHALRTLAEESRALRLEAERLPAGDYLAVLTHLEEEAEYLRAGAVGDRGIRFEAQVAHLAHDAETIGPELARRDLPGEVRKRWTLIQATISGLRELPAGSGASMPHVVTGPYATVTDPSPLISELSDRLSSIAAAVERGEGGDPRVGAVLLHLSGEARYLRDAFGRWRLEELGGHADHLAAELASVASLSDAPVSAAPTREDWTAAAQILERLRQIAP
jgi:hypothetical protein